MGVRTQSIFGLLPGLLAAVGVVAGSSLVAPPAAHAAAYTYGARQRTINAGILVVDDPQTYTGGTATPNFNNYDPGTTAATASDPAPYVFYILNQREDLKPFGWNIINPNAPRAVTGDVLTRWANRITSGPGYTLNQPITPNMAPYWEVSLSKASLTELEQYNVLLLPVRNHTVAFTDNEVNLLRRYVDNGGQLWVEDSGGGAISTSPSGTGLDPALFLNVKFNQGASGQFTLPTVTGAPGSLSLHQPILSTPYFLQPADLNNLGGVNPIAHEQWLTDAGGAQPDPILSSALLNAGTNGVNNQPFPAISAAQYGAGQVIIDAVASAEDVNASVGGTADTAGDPNAGPYSGSAFAAAPGPDLKFAYDILSWAGAHPTQHQTSHQSSSSPVTLGPAVTPLWTYPVTVTAPSTPAAAVNGDFVYVRDDTGVLDAFNATPGTDILGTGNPDAGFPDYVNGTPWDMIWNSAGAAFPNAGAPVAFTDPYGSGATVATIPSGQTLVFVEDSTGKVYAADATTGLPYPALGGGGTGAPYNATYPAPTPTYFGGRLFCGQPNGTLFVYDFRPNANPLTATYTVATGQPVIASPTVGFVSENIHNAGYVDDLVVTCTTPSGLYTLQGGARHDLLTPQGSNLAPQQANGSSPFQLETGLTDSQAYSDSGGYKNVLINANNAQGFPASPVPPGTFMGDYDASFNTPSSAGSSPLERAQFSFNGTNSVVSPAALDVNGNYYYIVNTTTPNGTDSTLVCAHDGRSAEGNPGGRLSSTQMRWRFRLPFTNEPNIVDADGISYAALAGYTFVGSPVIDNQGHVFALATNGTQSAMLCFNATQNVTVQLPVNSTNGAVNISQLTQPVGNTTADEFGVTPAPAVNPNGVQYNSVVNAIGRMVIQSFGFNGALSTGGTLVTPDLSEPQPVEATYTVSGANNASQTSVAPLHTNLAWYAIMTPAGQRIPNFPATVPLALNAGPSLIGNYLFFGDFNGNLYRLFAYPQSQSLVLPDRQVPLAQTNPGTGVTTPILTNDGHPLVASIPTNVGSIHNVVSASGNVLIVNGTAGVEAFGSQFTLVADASRVMEVDSEGVAQWAVDSTSELNPATGRATHVPLNHPADLTQITPNNYLVADTGNNRCVEFDRAGNVLWELTRFNDTALLNSSGSPIDFYQNKSGTLATKIKPLLAPGEPLTLSHPTGISSYVQTIPGGTIVHYLISDTGNDRILDVVSVYDSNGNQVGAPDNLVWVSHTADALGRHYAYTNAHYIVGPGGNTFIAALVSNSRVAPPVRNPVTGLPTGQMAPVSADAPGSSIVLLDYDPANYLGSPGYGANGQHDGMIAHAISEFLAYLTPTGTFNLAAAPKLVASSTPGGSPTIQPATAAPTLVYLRNPRFLGTYTPPGSGTNSSASPVPNFLLADDNGVYDLFLDPTGADSGASPSTQYARYLEASWGMTPVDYQNLVNAAGFVPAISGLLVARNGTSAPNGVSNGTQVSPPVPFVPNSIARTGTDPLIVNGTTYLMGHYIITNGYSEGQVTPVSGFGGEVDELAVAMLQGNPVTYLVSSFGKLTNNNAAPLSQPAVALREK